jgi:class 3 adenylate cyclase
VEAEPLGELRLKGIAQPIQAFKITALTRDFGPTV